MKGNFNTHGFTMIEVVLVLIVLFILSATILTRFTTGTNELIAETDILKSNIRFAQLMAMNDTATWGINFSSSTTYSLIRTTGTVPNFPGDSSTTHTIGGSVSIASGVGTTLYFNEWGVPSDALGTTPSGTDISLGLMDSQTHSSTVTIKKNTGYIP